MKFINNSRNFLLKKKLRKYQNEIENYLDYDHCAFLISLFIIKMKLTFFSFFTSQAQPLVPLKDRHFRKLTLSVDIPQFMLAITTITSLVTFLQIKCFISRSFESDTRDTTPASPSCSYRVCLKNFYAPYCMKTQLLLFTNVLQVDSTGRELNLS